MREPSLGLSIAQVTKNRDPDGHGRVEVFFPLQGEDSPRRWCHVAAPGAGDDRGLFFMPEEGDEVLVAFEEGSFEHAYIVGYPWNPVQRPPSGNPDQKVIRSRSGHTIRMLDQDANAGNVGALILEDGHGNAITMTNGVMTIHCNGHLRLEANTMTIMGRPVNPMSGAI